MSDADFIGEMEMARPDSPLPLSEAELPEWRHAAIFGGQWDGDEILRLLATIDRLRADLTAAQENKRTVFVGTDAKLCTDLAEKLEKAEAALRSFIGDYDAGMEFTPGELRTHAQELRAALRSIAAGTFKPDEVARAAFGEEAGNA